MATTFSLRVKENLKHSMKPQELKDDASAALAVIPWLLIPTFFGITGWAGLGVAFASTWGLGAIFNVPGMRRGAVALGAVQLAYAYASGSVQDLLGKPLWRFDQGGGVDPATVLSIDPSTPGVQGLASAMQAGAQLTRLPDGTYGTAYPGVAGVYTDQDPASRPMLNGIYQTGNSPNVEAMQTVVPRYAGSPWS